MPSDSVAGFLDRAKENRVLFPEQVEELIRQPDIPHSDLTALCDYLFSRGVLTRFQAAAIRACRGQELNFAGYPVIDEIGPCPGGTAYKALHPSLRTPLVLRRIKPDWLAPEDSIPEYLNRARAFGMLIHTNLVPLLDAGVYLDELYLVIDQPANSTDLATLAAEVGGAMPGFLAAEYGKVIASALRLAHERGGVHGDVRPENLLVGPLSVKKNPNGAEKRRPAPNAVVRLAELGLVPIRPPAAQYTPELPTIAYLPPERLDQGKPTTRGDLYGLGATLYFLLAGRPPHEGSDAGELLNRVRTVEPTSLAALRPDLPADLCAIITRMMDKTPEKRPETAVDVMDALAPFCRQTAVESQAIPMATPASNIHARGGSVADGTDHLAAHESETQALDDAWGAGSETFSSASSSAPSAPRKRAMSAGEKKRAKLYLIGGALLHITGVCLFLAWWFGWFEPVPTPDTTPTKKEPPAIKKKDKKTGT